MTDRESYETEKQKQTIGKIRVGILGPYTEPDPVINTRSAVLQGVALRELGFNVFVPHLFHLAHLIQPQPYQFWMDWDMSEYHYCDAFLRLPGKSSGADKEERRAEGMGKPVFHSVAELLAWAKVRNL